MLAPLTVGVQLLLVLASATFVCAQDQSSPARTKTANSSFSFPDEWDEHEATIMVFPPAHAYGRDAKAFQDEVAALANAIAKNETVKMFVFPADAKRARTILIKSIKLIEDKGCSMDWARDTAPLIVRNGVGKRQSVCFQFNSWGKKFPEWEEDALVAKSIAKHLKFTTVHSSLVLEGGAIEIGDSANGKMGIVTTHCVLNKNRTDWPKAKVEKELQARLGLKTIVWLDKGLMPDPITDGHVDGIVKFIKKNTVLVHTTSDKSDVNYAICQSAKKKLIEAGLKVIEFPLAEKMVHMNFYIGSGGKYIYVPICGDPKQDQPALLLLKKHFRNVVPIMANEIGKQGGGVHCLTQQVPSAKSSK